MRTRLPRPTPSPPFLKRFTKPQLSCAQWVPAYRLSLTGETILTDPSHPLQSRIASQLAQRARHGLWWHVHSGLTLSKKRVVRSWAQRRLRDAFRDALKLRGYDEAGVVLRGTAENEKTGGAGGGAGGSAGRGRGGGGGRRREPVEIFGTLRLLPHEKALTATFDALRADCVRIVDDVVRECLGNGGGGAATATGSKRRASR